MNADRNAVRAADVADAVRLCLTLTPRELEVLVLLAKGVVVKDAGALLGISKSTVEVHCRNILRKMDANKIIECAVIAAKAGLV